jgi:hypothetical protein
LLWQRQRERVQPVRERKKRKRGERGFGACERERKD